MGLIFSSFLIIGREIYVHSAVDYSAKGMFHKAFLICSLGILLAAVLVIMPVSYTHLDVYKRQPLGSA